MLRKVISLALVLGAASATASADRFHRRDRDDDRDERTDEGPRFHRVHADSYREGQRGDLVAQFSEPFDTRDGQGAVVVDLGPGVPLHRLVLDSTGNSEVFNIVVQYADGTSHYYSWNHVFNARTADGQAGRQLVMGMDGRVVRRLLINGYNAPRTRLSVLVQ